MDAWVHLSETAIDAENTKRSKKGENMEEINRARAKITDESQKIGGSLAIFIEEHVNKACTNEAVAKSVQEKSLKDLLRNESRVHERHGFIQHMQRNDRNRFWPGNHI